MGIGIRSIIERGLIMGRGRKAKGEYDDLPVDFKDAVAQASPDEIRVRMSQVASAEVENQKAKKNDLDLAEARVRYQDAGAQYKEASKQNKLKQKFCHQVLQDKGKA